MPPKDSGLINPVPFALRRRCACWRPLLVLDRCRDVRFDRRMSEEGFDFAFTHLERLPLAMQHDETLDSMDISVLGEEAVVQHPNRRLHAIEQPRPAIGG